MEHLSEYPYGEILRNISVSGFTLTETAYSPVLKLPKHSHKQAYFCFVLRGSFTEVYGKHSRSCRPSTLIFHPAGEMHSDQFHASTCCFNIQMKAGWLERVSQHSRLIDIPAHFHDGRLAHLAWRIYREFRDLDQFSSLVVEGLILEIIADVSRHFVRESTRIPPRWLREAREILREQLGEHHTLAELAESVNVHPAHLAREFRRFYRCTVGAYVRQMRVEFACREICLSDTPFGEIALAAGFFDQSHFARTFKTYTGMTPGQYRKALSSRKSPTNVHTPCKTE